MSSGKGHHRLDGSQHDPSWAGVMRQELDAERAAEVAIPPEVAAAGAQRTAEHLIGPPPPQPVPETMDPLGVDHERFQRAAAAYNQERTAAYQTFRMASDAAWAIYHTAMRQANDEYEQAINAAAEHYDLSASRNAR